MARHAAVRTDTVEWRRIGRYLWVAADDDGPMGTVEQGFRFKAIDILGNVVGRARTLEDAQELLTIVALADSAALGAEKAGP